MVVALIWRSPGPDALDLLVPERTPPQGVWCYRQDLWALNGIVPQGIYRTELAFYYLHPAFVGVAIGNPPHIPARNQDAGTARFAADDGKRPHRARDFAQTLGLAGSQVQTPHPCMLALRGEINFLSEEHMILPIGRGHSRLSRLGSKASAPENLCGGA
jgi:hypothetical protein